MIIFFKDLIEMFFDALKEVQCSTFYSYAVLWGLFWTFATEAQHIKGSRLSTSTDKLNLKCVPL